MRKLSIIILTLLCASVCFSQEKVTASIERGLEDTSLKQDSVVVQEQPTLEMEKAKFYEVLKKKEAYLDSIIRVIKAQYEANIFKNLRKG